MSVISVISARLRNTIRSFKTTSLGQKVFRVDLVKMKVRYSPGIDNLLAMQAASASGKILDDIIEPVADRMLDAMREQGEKFAASRALVDSFHKVRYGAGRMDIDSDIAYKSTWRSLDNQGIPTIAALRDWMAYIPNLSNEDDLNQTRIAFAIQKSFATGVGAGSTGLSRLRKLPPSGARMFDYVEEAYKQVRPELEAIGIAIKEIT